MMFQYFVKVVPTVYMKLDGQVSLQELRWQRPSRCQALASLQWGVKHCSYSHALGDKPRLRERRQCAHQGPGVRFERTCSGCIHLFLQCPLSASLYPMACLGWGLSFLCPLLPFLPWPVEQHLGRRVECMGLSLQSQAQPCQVLMVRP